ncbi:hypothetical protein [uncultured Streptococcus sp.]|uniref:hypothetical protein n=1 Tax=uncultured Streptococcus sp. TaxID=83427 RepID=UPI0025997677|nr:hypothetical protein [uncultured Streptococcus sp.]
MKKVLTIIGIVVVILIGIVAVVFSNLNKEKTSISANTFNTTMSSKGYVMTDTTSQFAQYGDYMTKSYAAQKSGYQIEFYELSSIENAISMYNTNQQKFESQKSNRSTSSTASMKNYSTYSLTTNGKYKYLSRIDNTLIYIDASDDYKDAIKDIIKELGY